MKDIHPMALFRLSVLGPLVSSEKLARGELQQRLHELAQREYAIPDSRRRHIDEKTIAAWYYAWRKGGIEALMPKQRSDCGQSKIDPDIQSTILAAKRENPRRSVTQIKRLLDMSGTPKHHLSRSAIHRLLQQHGLSRITGSASEPDEKRSFVSAHAGAIWYGDVLHGPRIPVQGRLRKTYLVSLLDDCSRLVTHSAFCLSEAAIDIEGVLKQALLKRGLPIRLVVDNGAAYRTHSLQGICARLGIHLIHCRPYAPEGKGKLERWHRTFRDHFLAELNERHIHTLDDLNARLWAWLEQVYHRTPHEGLDGKTPLQRYCQDLPHVRQLGAYAAHIDALFYHRINRLVKKDGTVSYEGQYFEVPCELAKKTVKLVVDPHVGKVVGVENDQGDWIGHATPFDPLANLNRQRKKGIPATDSPITPAEPDKITGLNLVELAHQKYYQP